MIEPVSITDPTRLESVEALLHDQTLDLHGLRHQKDNGVLEIPLLIDDDSGLELISNSWCRRLYKLPLRRGVLRIGHVVTYRVDDRGQIGRYTFLRMKWAPVDSILSIVAIEDMEIHVTVSAMDLKINVSGEIVGHRDVTMMFGFIHWYGPPRT